MTISANQRYMLITEDTTNLVENENYYIINNGSCKILEDIFPVETDIIERSFVDGAIAPGETRGTSKDLPFKIDFNNPSEQSFRTYYNTLLYWIRKAIRIRDRINQIETDVRVIEDSIIYDEGGQFKGSVLNVTFKQLIPFWKDVDWIEQSENLSLTNQIIINNTGYDTYPIFIVTVDQNLPKFLIKCIETNLGIGINDLNFGKTFLPTYIIDNENGEALLEGILRNDKIIAGTGFFHLRRGVNTLFVRTYNNIDVDFTIRYKRRYFI
jgi:hypothetical protein